MANQNVIINLVGRRSGPRGLRAVAVDTNGSAWTFTDLGAATLFTADDDYRIAAIQGQGTTAPGVTAAQFRLNGNDKPKFINLAAVFDPTSQQSDRLGAALGGVIPQGSALAIISRT